MENKVHGGFVLRDKQGNPIVGKTERTEDGVFVSNETEQLAFQPDEKILDDMAEKGLWGSFIYMAKQNGQEMDR